MTKTPKEDTAASHCPAGVSRKGSKRSAPGRRSGVASLLALSTCPAIAALVLLPALSGCPDAPCSGPACDRTIETPEDVAIAHDPDWSVGATIQDCANDTEPGNEAVADLPGLFWDNTTAAATPHRPATPDETAQLGEPLLVWRAVCNKSTMPAAQLLVQWTRALCINAENCLNATEIGFSTIPAQAICACTPAFLEDVVGDTPDEVAGLYRYALLYNGVELASAIVVVR